LGIEIDHVYSEPRIHHADMGWGDLGPGTLAELSEVAGVRLDESTMERLINNLPRLLGPLEQAVIGYRPPAL
jgi:hypothetical protein